MDMTVDKLGVKELDALIREAKARKAKLAKRKPLAAVRARLRAFVQGSGYTLEELLGRPAGGAAPKAAAGKPGKAKRQGGASRRSRGKGLVAPKYRNPDDPSQTWTGRGKTPLWVAAKIAEGRSKDEFLISGAPAV